MFYWYCTTERINNIWYINREGQSGYFWAILRLLLRLLLVDWICGKSPRICPESTISFDHPTPRPWFWAASQDSPSFATKDLVSPSHQNLNQAILNRKYTGSNSIVHRILCVWGGASIYKKILPCTGQLDTQIVFDFLNIFLDLIPFKIYHVIFKRVHNMYYKIDIHPERCQNL